MAHRTLVLVLMLASLPLAGCFGPSGPGPDVAPTRPTDDGATLDGARNWPEVELVLIGDGLDSPLDAIPLSDGRTLVVQQGGLVRVLTVGGLVEPPFLDVTAGITSGGERGLLGLAIDPRGRVYASYTDLDGDSILARYQTDDAGHVDPATAEILLRVDQPFGNHNGGHLAWGPDGMLWWGLGDGGSAGDPFRNGQDPTSLLGTLLRLDVAGDSGYVSPPDNPYATGGGRPEIAHIGLRNPWRFSFDRFSGDLYIGDVGENAIEEIDHAPAGVLGLNFGWNAWEGSEPYRGSPISNVTFPVAEYTHADTGGCSVTGGLVYRGAAIPDLNGTYLYADYCSGTLWGLRNAAGAWETRKLMDTGLRVSGMAEETSGEILLIHHGGALHRLVAK